MAGIVGQLLGPPDTSSIRHIIAHVRLPVCVIGLELMDDVYAKPTPGIPGRYLTYPNLQSFNVYGHESVPEQMEQMKRTVEEKCPNMKKRLRMEFKSANVANGDLDD